MKTSFILLTILLATVVMTACGGLGQIGNTRIVTASTVVITEPRSASNFTAIDMRTLGNVNITQGQNESVTVKGSDNVVPVITTTVSNGTLIIDSEKNTTFTGMTPSNMLTFTIVVKDLASLTISGLADVKVGTLSAANLALTMSGAGSITLDQLTADSLNITVSGLGNVALAGQVTDATVNIPGAGNVSAPDLKIETAGITVSGLGNAVVWVTGQLNGTISGAGSVSYYGSPNTSTSSTGLGSFKSLGSK